MKKILCLLPIIALCLSAPICHGKISEIDSYDELIKDADVAITDPEEIGGYWDARDLYITYDEERISVKVDFYEGTDILSFKEMCINIDVDRNPATGLYFYGLGADYTVTARVGQGGAETRAGPYSAAKDDYDTAPFSDCEVRYLDSGRYLEIEFPLEVASIDLYRGFDLVVDACGGREQNIDESLVYEIRWEDDIRVDGSPEDWVGINPAVEAAHVETCEGMYLASDSEYLYHRFDTVDAPVSRPVEGIDQVCYMFSLFYDVDHNSLTGGDFQEVGAEYYVEASFRSRSSRTVNDVNLFRWDGDGWKQVISDQTLLAFDDVFEFKVPLALLGLEKGDSMIVVFETFFSYYVDNIGQVIPLGLDATEHLVSFTSNRMDVSLMVDGELHALPTCFTWAENAVHTVEVVDQIQVDDTTRYAFTGWGDGSADEVRKLSLGKETDLVLLYDVEYYLDIVSDRPIVGEGWYREDEAVGLKAAKKNSLLTEATLLSWGGDLQGSEPMAMLLMDAPKTVYAEWSTDYTRAYLMTAALGVVLTGYTARRVRQRSMSIKREQDNEYLRGAKEKLLTVNEPVAISVFAEENGVDTQTALDTIRRLVSEGELDGVFSKSSDVFYKGSTIKEMILSYLHEDPEAYQPSEEPPPITVQAEE
ncbi:hypothetical protein JXL21_13370 [Candidatus Bathyarchaeota archaeon]|nr:hypothetical protein [Candidatus Bathyarchaeota archaeon]